MKYQDINPAAIRGALNIYLSNAYPAGVPEKTKIPKLIYEGCDTREVLGVFTKEEKTQPGYRCLLRWVLRLGNERYPFMKLIVHEHILEGEFIFAVDTHDDLNVAPGSSDYEPYQCLRKFNKDLKVNIEKGWQRADLDTCAVLREKLKNLPVNPAGCGHGKRAVVVDDEEVLAEACAYLLKAEGFDVSMASNGKEGLERIRERRPHLVLTDYEMPEMDGIQLIEKIREDCATKGTPVILTSAKQLSFAEMGRANAFVSKPFCRETLIAYCELLLTKSTNKRSQPSVGACEAFET